MNKNNSSSHLHTPYYPVSYQYKSPRSSNNIINYQNKYNYFRPYQPSYPVQKNSRFQTINPQILQMQFTINQLKGQLALANDRINKLQNDYQQQKSKSLDLLQNKRRLQQQFNKMQYQLDRINNYEQLNIRQISIKYQNLLRQNTKYSRIIEENTDKIEHLKKQNKKISNQLQILQKQNKNLLLQNENLKKQILQICNQVNQVKQQINKQSLLKNQSKLLDQIKTIKSINIQSQKNIHSFQHLHQHQSNILQHINQQKLIQDYQKLLAQNHSMKKLYKQLHEEEHKGKQKYYKQQNYQHLFTNSRISQELTPRVIKEEDNQDEDILLKTQQRKQLEDELKRVRDQSVNQLITYLEKSIKIAKNTHKNSIKIFYQDINKNIQILSKMASNYLELRQTIFQGTGIKLPLSIQGLPGKVFEQGIQMFKTVKQGVKTKNHSTLSVAIFRLLVLISKKSSFPTLLIDNFKHYVLKYLYKLGQL